MSIPKNINKEHVIEAIQKIDREGVPDRRESTRFNLSYTGNYYPPKYVISIANIFANGEEYSPSMFSGGDETNRFLTKLDFEIVENKSSTTETEYEENYFIIIPGLEPVNRSREFHSYPDLLRDLIVYEYLFNSRTHRWIDEQIIGLNPDESRGYQAMGILHFIGLKDKHKGYFKDFSISKALFLLKQQLEDFGLVIQCLQRHKKRISGDFDSDVESPADEYIELEALASAAHQQIEITETEKEQIIKSRIGQSAFKKALLAIEKKCRICGVTDERFLIASHIKPWSQSNNQERLDVNNGLLLCPNHDALFDKGYISFDDDGTILISDILDEATRVFLNINETMKISMSESQRGYMKWHRENLFIN
jgi:hypothetical protein